MKWILLSFSVHVSVDNRYKLYINGKLASLGPARGEHLQWNYETVNLAPLAAYRQQYHYRAGME
ncbi:hypothetical protein [Deminuibacter soli]|uniref:Uncharacterized protein n=1 Tax=Deminuibacter soli TaxID=2291815 RepID=A0A3E1NGQ8_9BACT|nr:hypothetical protein [Deminuibacter soli]RFM27024.1 hypothetical protein DXN05_16250 [Deminuibacter soli]